MERVSIFEGKIKANAEKRKSIRSKAQRLQRAPKFNKNLDLSGEYKIKAKQLFNSLGLYKNRYKVDSILRNFKILLANLLRKNEYVAISLNRNNWVNEKYSYANYYVLELIEELTKAGFVEKSGFFYNHEPAKKKIDNRMTRIKATDKLLKEFITCREGITVNYPEVIILRGDNKTPIEYSRRDETPAVKKARKVISRINEINGSADIYLGSYKIKPALVAIYKFDFKSYGRIHARGAKYYQGYDSDDRKRITINGDATVELDFKALHPTLLYAQENIQLNEDPYMQVNKNLEKRKMCKKILLALLNGEESGRNSAHSGAIYALKKLRDKDKNYPFTYPEIKRTIAKFNEVHAPIAKHFCNGKRTGLKIMNKDAQIAVDIIEHFAGKEIPILPIHDSFIVQKQYKDELKTVMGEAYKKHTKGFEIIVEEK